MCDHTANIIAKHHPEMSDVIASKVQIGNKTSLCGRHFSLMHITKCVRQTAESFLRNRSKNSTAVTEVVIRRLVAHASSSCDFSHRKRFGTVRFDDCDGGIENESANIAVLLGRGGNHDLTVQLDSVKYND